MYKIIHKEELAPSVCLFKVIAPDIAKKRQAGQFVIIIANEKGERIPLTIADANPDEGWITIVCQAVGKSTYMLNDMKEGDSILSVVGPLGQPTHIENYGTCVCIGGGVGIAPVYPIAEAMKIKGNRIISILGARSKDLLIMEDYMRKVSEDVIITTDDGSYGKKGLVTDALQELIDKGERIDLVLAIGPVIMMKYVSLLTKKYNIRTMVSLNPIMVDGTGMCGCCRVTIGEERKFACVDGPEFDGHFVDYDELMMRLSMYKSKEKVALESYLGQKDHKCQAIEGHST